jgi:hypothetical protein
MSILPTPVTRVVRTGEGLLPFYRQDDEPIMLLDPGPPGPTGPVDLSLGFGARPSNRMPLSYSFYYHE